MALSQKHRSAIYARLEPMLGEEEAEALLAQFPARDIDEPVTKDFVHAEIESLRSEMNHRFGEVHSEMNERFGALNGEMIDRFGEVHSEMNERFGALNGEMNHRFGTVQSDIERLRADLTDRLRAQTAWMSASMIAGLGLAMAIGRAIG